ncbi:MAG: hypothetical protein HC836_22675 [Richelia sp. RM2_1_2]|nr:hypothetical protein [Richelia sp. RM2_1_2]
MAERTLERDAEDALSRWLETKKIGKQLSHENLMLAASEIEAYLTKYIAIHKDAKLNNKQIEKRRQDHWDLINKKCSENEMFRELWNQVLLLLKLEQENLK